MAVHGSTVKAVCPRCVIRTDVDNYHRIFCLNFITLADNFTPKLIEKFRYLRGTNLGISDEGESSICFSNSVCFVAEYRRRIEGSGGDRMM